MNTVSPLPPPGGMNQGGGAKPGWRRVSTRQWIRDFRDHISKFQTYPYKTMCGMFFWSFGYYPDMVPEATYNKYISKYPAVGRHPSMGSGQHYLPPPMSATDFSSNMSSTTAMSAAPSKQSLTSANDNNANLGAAAGGKKKKGKGKGGADGRESISSEVSDSSSAGGGKSGKKGKKKKGDGNDEGGEKRDSDASAGSEATKKKGKKKKGEEGGADDDASSATPSKKGKGKKGKGKDAPSTLSGNIAFDPEVYDLSTLTVMNLPAGANAAKLKKLFPGATITMEGGGASVKFGDAAAAQPFFTKEVSLDGQSLVISPKLKS